MYVYIYIYTHISLSQTLAIEVGGAPKDPGDVEEKLADVGHRTGGHCINTIIITIIIIIILTIITTSITMITVTTTYQS